DVAARSDGIGRCRPHRLWHPQRRAPGGCVRRDSSGAPAGRTSRGARIRDPAVTPRAVGLSDLFPARASPYWPASVCAFATPDEFEKILTNHRFVEVRADPLTLGIVFLYTARKR